MKNHFPFPAHPFPARHALLSLLLTLLLPSLATAATLTVALDGSGQYSAIQPAIDAAQSGDTVLIAPGTYTGPGNVDLDFGGKNLTVTSQAGVATTIIDCGGTSAANHRAFYIHSGETNAVIGGLTLRNGYESNDNGGAVSIGSSTTVTLTNCTLSGNTASDGGGISNSGTATLTGCILSGNTGDHGGGILNIGLSNCTVALTNCILSGNVAGTGGGLFNFYGEAATLTGCTLTGNSADGATGGGGISNNGTAALINCVVTNNAATSGNGGGINNANNSQLTLQFCTFAGNSTQEADQRFATQGGALENDGTATLTDDILWGDTAPSDNEIGTTTNTSPVTTVSYSDIQGGYTGTGNIDVDPLFVNPSGNDFQLIPGSPALGAGTTITGVTTDLDGNTRANSPTIGAYELPEVIAAHLLWTHSNGTASVWFVKPDGSYNYQTYGPYDGWTAQSLAAGSDGKVRLLWTHAGGLASLWNLGDAHPDQTCHVYGSFANWTATSLSVGTDNVPHLLWQYTNGIASVWNVNGDGTYTFHYYGPYTGWTASQIAGGSGGAVRLLWTHAGGLASLWNLADAHPDQTYHLYGPFDGWSAVGLSVGADSLAHLLWTHMSGLASAWNINTDGTYSYQLYGPYDGWSVTGISGDAGGGAHLLWTHGGGLASLWNLSDAHPDQTFSLYGPFDGWSAVSLAGP